MKRSKNHLLYELYLEELGMSELFNKTNHLSLGHIVDFVRGVDPLPESIDEYTDKDFSVAASRKLLDKLDWAEYQVVVEVIDKIDEYHRNK